MPEPLDYRNPRRENAADPIERSPPAPETPLVAVPVEFDTTIAKTGDHAAIMAIEASLKREQIDYFRNDNGARVNRSIELLVRKADADLGVQIAGEIFVR